MRDRVLEFVETFQKDVLQIMPKVGTAGLFYTSSCIFYLLYNDNILGVERRLTL